MTSGIASATSIDVLTVQSPRLILQQRLHALLLVIVPAVGTVAAIAHAAIYGFGAFEATVLITLYFATLSGITLGFHRLWAHRAFQARAPFRLVLGILGSMTAQGPLLYWTANHRRHHKFSDREHDVHSPVWSFAPGNKWRGFVRAQITWPFHVAPTNTLRLVGDLMSDPIVVWVNRTYLLWVITGLALPAAIGFAVIGSAQGAVAGLLWGGFARVFVTYHATSAVNSICHLFGRQRFRTRDNSRNNAWLALLTLGESWHNNHHAFPWSARLGLCASEPDPGAWILQAVQGLGWVHMLRVPSSGAIRQSEAAAGKPRQNTPFKTKDKER